LSDRLALDVWAVDRFRAAAPADMASLSPALADALGPAIGILLREGGRA